MQANRPFAGRGLDRTILAGLIALGVTFAACGQEPAGETPAATPTPPPQRTVERPEDIPPPPPAPAAPTTEGAVPAPGAMAESPTEGAEAEEDEYLTEALNDLRSSDAEVRADAVLDIEPEGVGLRYLIDTLGDPDPEVRMAVISQLEDADEDPTAIAGIVSALEDSNSEVVIEAIDALEFVGDPSVISSLQALSDHPNEEVREAAVEAIEYLEE